MGSAQTGFGSFGGYDEEDDCYHEVKNCVFTFARCKISVSVECFAHYRAEGCKLEIYGQVEGELPIMIAQLGVGEFWCEANEASDREFATLMSALDLHEMLPPDLLAVLLVASECAPLFGEHANVRCESAGPGAILCSVGSCTNKDCYGNKLCCTQVPHLASALGRVMLMREDQWGLPPYMVLREQ